MKISTELTYKVIDYHLPGWAKTYTGAVPKALGDAYAEPAKDVEGYIAYIKGQKG
jgi:glutathione S-transferase